MSKLKSINPKEFWTFFSDKVPPEKVAVFLTPEKTGLVASTTEKLDDPPNAKNPDKVKRSAFMVFLKILVALKGGRPVKLIPVGKTEWKVFYGPRP